MDKFLKKEISLDELWEQAFLWGLSVVRALGLMTDEEHFQLAHP